MKKIILFMFMLISVNMYGQRAFSYSKNINGYWGQWKNSVLYSSGEVLQGTYDEFIIYNNSYHPSAYILKVKINGLVIESSKKEKARMKVATKTNTWYEYTGTVEYFISDYCNTAKEVVNRWPHVPNAIDTGSHSYIRPATIKIQPFKRNPVTYNIFFDGCGIGIQLN